MKFRTPFLIVISILQGYILWTYSALGHYWVRPGIPIRGVIPSACIFCLLGIIGALFIINFALAALNSKNPLRIFLNTFLSFTAAHILTILLSQVMDMMPEGQYYGYDAFSYYKLNPIMLPVELFYLGTLAIVITGVVFVVFLGVEKVLGKSQGQD